jgi:hypothetical protein
MPSSPSAAASARRGRTLAGSTSPFVDIVSSVAGSVATITGSDAVFAAPTARQALLHDVAAMLLRELAVVNAELRAIRDRAITGLSVPQFRGAARVRAHTGMMAAF